MNLVGEVRLGIFPGLLLLTIFTCAFFLPNTVAAAALFESTDMSQTMVVSDPEITSAGILNTETCYEYTVATDGVVGNISFYQNVDSAHFPLLTLRNKTAATVAGVEQNIYSWQYAPNNYVEGVADGLDEMTLYTLSSAQLRNFYSGPQEIVLASGDVVELCLGAYSKPNYFPKTYGYSETQGDGIVAYTVADSAEENCTENCHSNVLFLPGFVGSRLYTFSGDRKVWEPNGGDDVRDLAMNPDGTSKFPIYVGDVIDKIEINGISLGTIYGNLLAWMESLKTNGLITEARAFPYDWRYDVFGVVNDGVLKESGEREYLLEVIEDLALTSKTGKVTLIGHSNGGLLAKAAMLRLAEVGKEDLVDRVIFIGTPQVGTPQGMLGLLHGRDILNPIIALDGTTRASASTMPGAYSLLPSKKYFDITSEPIATLTTGVVSDEYRDIFGEAVDSLSEYVSLLLNEPYTRDVPEVHDEEIPLPLSRTLWEEAEATHELLDTWEPPEGVSIHEIAGWGNKTTAGAEYFTEKSYSCPNGFTSCGFYDSIDFRPITTRDGDTTVLTKSALFQDSGVYFDLAKLREDFDENRKHESITESEHLYTYLEYLFGITTEYNTSLFVSAPAGESEIQTIISTHSPVIVSLRDSLGRESGVFSIPNSDLFYTKTDIPNSSVHFGGGGKYVYVPSGEEYEINIQGIGNGTFTVRVEDESGEVKKEFTNLPVNEDTKAMFTVSEEETTPLLLDTDGNGSTDMTIGETLTRKDALKLCRSELKGIRPPLIRAYLLAILLQMEHPRVTEGKFANFINAFRQYVEQKLRTIPQGQREALATCITALENSKK